ncbi:MAG: hypothetical protein AAF773_13495 [Cyanobacteria bacterium P01_D01_bin.115]
MREQLRNIDREELLRNPGEYLRDPEGYLTNRGVDIEALQRETETHFTRPWAERRGVEYSDRNSHITLVRSPIAQLSNAIAESAIETQRDVLDSEIEMSNLFGLTYQLVGHDWSIFIWASINVSNTIRAGEILSAAQLSNVLR